MRDHGGNIDEAIAIFGGDPEAWIDLSTGINRKPYPLPVISQSAWADLPTKTGWQGLCAIAAAAYETPASVLPVPGAQAAIQLIPRLRAPGDARVLAPTYNEHAAALSAQGWRVTEVARADELTGADLAVLVNPNNPDGGYVDTDDVLKLADRVRYLVVDESFADARPDCSVAPMAGRAGLLVLRSFGKFYGLAGLRLGFVLGHADDLDALSGMSGPWSVSGPALEIGCAALADVDWRRDATARLMRDASRLDQMAAANDWGLVGGTELFRTYLTSSAVEAQRQLAQHKIWSRIFPYSKTWLRLGLPGNEAEWARLQEALAR